MIDDNDEGDAVAMVVAVKITSFGLYRVIDFKPEREVFIFGELLLLERFYFSDAPPIFSVSLPARGDYLDSSHAAVGSLSPLGGNRRHLAAAKAAVICALLQSFWCSHSFAVQQPNILASITITRTFSLLVPVKQ